MSRELVIFGTGQQAELAHFYFSKQSDYRVVAFTVDDEFMDSKSPCGGVPIICLSELQNNFCPGKHDAFVAIGYSELNSIRKNACEKLRKLDYKLASFISPKAINYSEHIGDNCFILEHNTIQPFVKIGNNVTIWSGNHIGHHTKIENDCFITSHSVISGGCHIKEQSFIGVNSTIRDRITIGRANIIGAGCLILKDTEDDSIFSCKMATKSSVPSSKLRKI